MTKPNSSKLIIAIDGPAASGKGTIARKLADYFKLPYLDTGLTYRAVAVEMLRQKNALDDEDAAIKIAQALDLSQLNAHQLKKHNVAEAASQVARLPRLRTILTGLQQKFAASGAVLDGRDIGTVVCPNAQVKLYITASIDARAQRRFQEITEHGDNISYAQIWRDIQKRDHRDQARMYNPLKKAADAYLIDTTEMDIDTAFQTSKDYVLQTIR